MRVLVLSTFDIWPPKDGGQTRYVNIWKKMPPRHEISILVYDFRNLASERRYKLTKNLEVIVPQASESDARHFHYMAEKTGLWLHDVLCLTDYMFSEAFLKQLTEAVNNCDVLVASHPYLATLAFPLANLGTKKVYESYNVEFDIKKDYFSSSSFELKNYLSAVLSGERYAINSADLVTTVSMADKYRLIELYGVQNDKVSVVPNGANIRSHDLLNLVDRKEVRDHLRLDASLVGIFLGSSYPANVKSYLKSRDMLQSAGFSGTMLLVGSIDQARDDSWKNVDFEERWFGFVDESLKEALLSISDFALHLIFSGAGTNLKLYDYMGAGVPIVANRFGQRGVEYDNWCLRAETQVDLIAAFEILNKYPDKVSEVTRVARSIALREFDWQSISNNFEKIISN